MDGTRKDSQDRAGEKAREEELKEKMLRIARMFTPHQDAPLMRQLCLIAIKCLHGEGAARG